MSYDTAVWSRFRTAWADRTPIAPPNVAFAKPTGLAWVRPTLQPAGALYRELSAPGGRTIRNFGQFVVQVFVPEGDGDAEAMTLAEAVCAAFRGVSEGGVTYAGLAGEGPRTRVIGNDGDGWFQVNAEIPLTWTSTF